MKTSKKLVSLVLALTLVMSFVCMPAQAAKNNDFLEAFGKAASKIIEKTIENIKEIYKADEDAPKVVLKNMSDKNGKTSKSKEVSFTSATQPVIYNGRTYIPLRAVCEAIGYQVNWDGKTQVITLKANFLKKDRHAFATEAAEGLVPLEKRYNQAYSVWYMFRDAYKNGVKPSVNETTKEKYGFTGIKYSDKDDVADVLNSGSAVNTILLRVGHNKAHATITDNGLFGLFTELDGDWMALEYTLDAVPVVIDGVTLIPLRAATELMGMNVAYDGKTNTITITAKNSGKYIEEEEKSFLDTIKDLK